jgi:hypothetical protein
MTGALPQQQIVPDCNSGRRPSREVCESEKPRRFQEEHHPTIWNLLFGPRNMNAKVPLPSFSKIVEPFQLKNLIPLTIL